MDQQTRAEVAGAIQMLRSGLAILEGLAEHPGSDLKQAERRELQTALMNLDPGIDQLSSVLLQAQQRAPKGRHGNLRPEVS